MTSRTLLVEVASEVLDHRRARHQPRDAWENKWAARKGEVRTKRASSRWND